MLEEGWAMVDTVYIVTSGEYSDYSIDAVFLDREMADDYVAARNIGARYSWNTYRVEAYPVNKTLPKKVEVLTEVLQVPRDGAIRRFSPEPQEVWENDGYYSPVVNVMHLEQQPNDLIQITVIDAPDVARKRAGEIAAQVAAEFDMYVDAIREGNVSFSGRDNADEQ